MRLIYDYDWKFVTNEYQKKRLGHLFIAIDSGDTELYWSNRKAWFRLHGFERFANGRLDTRRTKSQHIARGLSRVTKRSLVKKYKKYRDCFGEYDETHSFCRGVCGIRDECLGVS